MPALGGDKMTVSGLSLFYNKVICLNGLPQEPFRFLVWIATSLNPRFGFDEISLGKMECIHVPPNFL
jgi:hypothetical protein